MEALLLIYLLPWWIVVAHFVHSLYTKHSKIRCSSPVLEPEAPEPRRAQRSNINHRFKQHKILLLYYLTIFFLPLSGRAQPASLNHHTGTPSTNLQRMPLTVNTTGPWGISCISSTAWHTTELEGLCFRAYPRISAWKSSFCPGRPRVHWALPNRDCVTAGNFWFCFVHRSRRITSSGTHLTRLPLLHCPLLNPYSGFHLPAKWKLQQWRDSLVLIYRGCLWHRDRIQSDLLHLLVL